MARIVIAGGGIAGLAAAIAAAKAGHEVELVEQASRFEEVGAGIQMGPNGRRALEWLGVWERLQPAVVHPRAIRIRRASGGELGRLPLDAAFRERFAGTYQVVHRADLLDALLTCAREVGSVSLRTGLRVTGYHLRNAGGGVEVLTDEDSRRGPLAPADALIGADGIRSAVRAAMLDDGPPRPAGHVLYRALVDSDAVPSTVDTDDVCLWLHAGGHVVHYPVSAGRRFNIVVAVDENWQGEGWSSPSAGERVRQVFADACPELAAVLALPQGWLRWPGADRPPAARWGDGPVTLIGDAAHPTLPYLASGAVMALEDAVVLGQALLAAGSAPGADAGALLSALRRYEAARRPRTARIVARSHALAGIYHAAPPLSWGRDLFIRAQSGRAGLSRMAWLYDWRP